ncbi:hypothetical protein ABMA27_016064 [Loxostege sticticalis]|uniref:FLYWCH-type domain-containing protein n=1 Tax=Loxostege sticticalis TaxID=481309 RepID=A0ABR3I5F9_LOXSC
MSTEDFQIITRGRGKVLLSSGYQFYQQRVYKNGKSKWRCKRYKDTKCAGSVTLDQDKILLSKSHCNECHPSENQNEIDMIINNSCKEAANGREPAPRVFNRGLACIQNKGLHLAASAPVPDFKCKKSSIYRQRNKIASVQKINTRSVGEIEVPIQFQGFLLADYFSDPIRVIVFCSDDCRNIMEKVNHFFMDGTFKSCPLPFKQIFSVHGDIGSDCNQINIIPLLYAFMSHQTEEAYSILFDLIKSQIPNWTPHKVTIDFEVATMKALSKLNATVKGCQYHFSNSLWRKAKQLGINKKKLDRRLISLTTKLPFLPANEINVGWEYIRTEIEDCNNEGLKKFEAYFQSYWMKEELIDMWCIYGEQHRTNNAVEGWHHKINNEVNKNQGNILQMLHIFFDDAKLSSLRYYKNNNNPSTSVQKRRRVDVENDDFIRKLITGQINVGHFLEMIR